MTTGGPDESALGDPIESLLTEWARQCHKQGGLVVLPHFPNPRAEHAASIVAGDIDALEMTSWGDLYSGIDPYSLADWYRYLNCGYPVAAVGGTDKMTAQTAVGTVRTYARLDPQPRFVLQPVAEVVAAVRAAWPAELPLLVRISATDWVEGGWDVEQSVALCRILRELGADLVDVSSGGLVPYARVPAGPGYQTGFAERIRREAGVPTGAVGMITSPEQADHVVRSGQADLVLLARELLRDPYFALRAAKVLRAEAAWPKQYDRAK